MDLYLRNVGWQARSDPGGNANSCPLWQTGITGKPPDVPVKQLYFS
jgi:hypothetical protein